MNLSYNKLYEKCKLLEEENKRLKNEMILLKKMLSEYQQKAYNSTDFILNKEDCSEQNNNLITMNSPSKDKIELFKSLFRGRVDVCAKRWRNRPGYSPYCFNDFKSGICAKPKVKCTECKNSDFAPFDEERIKNHLLGKYVLGLYPMTLDDTCFLLVMDFDESTWAEDIRMMLEICNKRSMKINGDIYHRFIGFLKKMMKILLCLEELKWSCGVF